MCPTITRLECGGSTPLLNCGARVFESAIKFAHSKPLCLGAKTKTCHSPQHHEKTTIAF